MAALIDNIASANPKALAYFNFQADFGEYHPTAQEQIDIWGLGESDSVVNSHSETDTIMLKIPFVEGRQEWPLPVMIVPTGGVAYRRRYTLDAGAWASMATGYKRGRRSWSFGAVK